MEVLLEKVTKKGKTVRKPLLPLFLVKFINYEYWPFWLLFFPAVFYWLYLGWRAGSWAYFSAANPGIERGGIFGESKSEILNKINDQYKPISVYISKTDDIERVSEKIHQQKIQYPFIAKPDKGEMGFRVEVIHDVTGLQRYTKETPVDFIIQEFIDFDLELGVLYYRFPEGRSGISSIVKKEFLSVTGDGTRTVEELMMLSDRARIQFKKFRNLQPDLLKTIPGNREKILLEPIGNHCRGTRFINACSMINPQLVAVFDDIAKNMDGFYFGRFDLKVKSLEDLYAGRNIKIMEVNGCTSEPGHIYSNDMHLIKVYHDIFHNMKLVNDIAIANHRNGIPYITLPDILKSTWQHFKMKRENGS